MEEHPDVAPAATEIREGIALSVLEQATASPGRAAVPRRPNASTACDPPGVKTGEAFRLHRPGCANLRPAPAGVRAAHDDTVAVETEAVDTVDELDAHEVWRAQGLPGPTVRRAQYEALASERPRVRCVDRGERPDGRVTLDAPRHAVTRGDDSARSGGPPVLRVRERDRIAR